MRADEREIAVRAASAKEALGFVKALADASSRALDDGLAGVVLHGSLVLGDYVPGCSDLDLLVVVDGALTDTQRAALGEAVGHMRWHDPLRLDLRVVTRAVAGAPRASPPMEAYVTIRQSRDPRVHVEGPHPERDLVIELSICRAHGRSILGVSPAELIAEAWDQTVLDVSDAQLADWQAIGEDPPYAQLTVLTACRLWRFAAEREHCSKRAAGEWALRRNPRLAVVRDALDQRHHDPERGIDAAAVQALLMLVRGRLAELRGARVRDQHPDRRVFARGSRDSACDTARR